MWGVMRMSRPSRVATRPFRTSPNRGLIAAHSMVELYRASSPPNSPDFLRSTYCIDPCIATTESLKALVLRPESQPWQTHNLQRLRRSRAPAACPKCLRAPKQQQSKDSPELLTFHVLIYATGSLRNSLTSKQKHAKPFLTSVIKPSQP